MASSCAKARPSRSASRWRCGAKFAALWMLSATLACGEEDVASAMDVAPADVTPQDVAIADVGSPADSAAGDAAGEASDSALSATLDAALNSDALADALSDGGSDGWSDGSADAAPPDAPAASDVGQTDANPADVSQADAPPTDAGAGCAPPTAFDYTCDAAKPATCPGGMCLLGLCLGPKLDQNRWKSCGDGVCGACESTASCPADCGGLPKLSGSKKYDGNKTLTVWVHGFSNKAPAALKKLTYGSVKGCGDLYKQMKLFGATIPCGSTSPGDKAANQFVAVEYYGGKSPPWMSQKDIKQVEAWPVTAGAKGLQRYALIVAKFIRWRLKLVGATHVNLACHSMGCLVIRHLLENNYENLAAERRFVRWYTNTGVIAGARLARLYDNPAVQQGAKALGLELGDFVLMNPDNVMDVTAWWDHKLYAGNTPLLGGMLIHHTIATDPKIKQALKIQLLDLNNPGDEPNDGIMYSLDQYFHSQQLAARMATKGGVKLASTRTWAFYDHMTNPGTSTVGVLGVAALYHKRKVVVTLEEIELYSDLEKDNLLDLKNTGEPPAEVGLEVVVRYDPFIKKLTGKSIVVSEQRVAHRSAELFTMKEKTTKKPGIVVFSGPVYDKQKALHLALSVLEVDWYPRFKVAEWLLDPHDMLVAVNQQLPLTDQTYEFKSKAARIKLSVQVHTMY